MNFRDSPEEAAFRTEVRAWLDANARRLDPNEPSSGGLTSLLSEASDNDDGLIERAQAWQRTLAEGGWVGLTWPKAYGGRELSLMQLIIWHEELSSYDVPPNIFGIGQGMIGPTIIAHGTEEQKHRYLKPMLSGVDIWCQLWSEPNAGSDLASLQTRALRDDDGPGVRGVPAGWVLNGQKVWTSGAHYSHLGLIIARTDPGVPKHRGITCFIVDMNAAGVDVRPLRQMTGGANFNEVFLTDVRVPDSDRVGDVNDGWRVALTVLMNERMSVAGNLNVSEIIDPLIAAAKNAASSSHTRQALGDLYVRAKLLTMTGHRVTTKIAKGTIPGPEGSVAKLVWADLISDIAASGIELKGLRGAINGDVWADTHLFAPGLHIGGGTDEVMRNIIGERVLGLPKEPVTGQSV